MYAGVEHLGRATASAVDAMLIVVEPTARSLGTAKQIKSLAEDLKIQRLYIVGSKVRDEADESFILENALDLPVIGFIPEDDSVRVADREGTALYHLSSDMAEAGRSIAQKLVEFA